MHSLIIVLSAVVAAALWIAFRVRWWQRVHYHSLWGRTLEPAQVKRRLLELLVELDRVLAPSGIDYWLDWGTLLGAYRHRGFIPWDDDLDVSILHDDHDRLLALADRFAAPCKLVVISRWWSLDKIVPGLARIWPCRTFLRLLDTQSKLYVDIFELARQGDGNLLMLPLSSMHVPKDASGRRVVVAEADVFPLARLPFERGSFPVPADVEAYLHVLFGNDLSPDRQLDPHSGKYVKRPRPVKTAGCSR